MINDVQTENTEEHGGPQADYVGERESSEFKLMTGFLNIWMRNIIMIEHIVLPWREIRWCMKTDCTGLKIWFCI